MTSSCCHGVEDPARGAPGSRGGDGDGDVCPASAAIRRESGVQGSCWSTVHHGYFGDERVARPLLKAVVAASEASPPSVLTDLGGGTGFLLCQLLQHYGYSGAGLVNADLSPRQLAECCEPRIRTLQASASQVERQELVTDGGSLMLMMRSVLHYFGCEGTRRLLSHLRAQMRAGEYFIHQSACFWLGSHRSCLNLLYQRMETGKWYPLVAELEFLLERAGWEVVEVAEAPRLLLDSASLAERYHLTEGKVLEIRDELLATFGPVPHVCEPEEDGFTAWLHYHVFTCRAA